MSPQSLSTVTTHGEALGNLLTTTGSLINQGDHSACAPAQMYTGASQRHSWKWSEGDRNVAKDKNKNPAERQSHSKHGSPGDLAVE